MRSRNHKQKKIEDQRILNLKLTHAFGSSGQQKINDSVNFYIDHAIHLVYPAGKFVILKEYENSVMKKIKLKDNRSPVTSLAVDSEKKKIAIAQKGKDHATISFVYIKKNAKELKTYKDKVYSVDPNNYTFTESKSCMFICMAFSPGDARFIVCLAKGKRGCQLMFLDIQRMQPQGMKILESPLYNKVTINPKFDHRIVVSGVNVLGYLRVSENSFKLFSDIKDLDKYQNFTDHAWFDLDTLITTNDKGQINVIRNERVVQRIENAFKTSKEEINAEEILHGITAISTIPKKGFIVGSPFGKFAIWAKTMKEYSTQEQKNAVDKVFFPIKIWNIDRKSSITSINCSPTGEFIAVAFTSNDIATFQWSNAILIEKNLDDEIQNNNKYKEREMMQMDLHEEDQDLHDIQRKVELKYVYDGFHNAGINSMDICKHRPFLISCSKQDSTIRIWNYMNYKCELARKFYVGAGDDSQGNIKPLQCVALHPNGFYMAVAFINKLRFYHILQIKLRLYREIILKHCTLIKFSDGGQWLAASHPYDGQLNTDELYQVTIYNAYTTEILKQLKPQQVPIIDLCWMNMDQSIYTANEEGLIFEYKLAEKFKPDGMTLDKSKQKYMALAPSNETVFSVGWIEEKGEQVFKMWEITNGAKKEMSIIDQHTVTTLCCATSQLNMTSLIIGTQEGEIIVFYSKYNREHYKVYNCHSSAVTQIICSADGKFLFSSGEDGVVLVFEIEEFYGRGKTQLSFTSKSEAKNQKQRPAIVDEQLADAVLIERSNFEEKEAQLNELRLKVEELGKQLEIQQNEDKNKLKREKQLAQAQKNVEIEAASQRYRDLYKEKLKKEEELQQLLRTRDKNHLKAVLELEALYEKKLAFETEKYMTIEQELEEEKINHETQKKQLLNNHQETIEKLKMEFKISFNKSHTKYDETKKTAEQLKQDYEVKLALQEDAHEEEITGLQQKHQIEKEKLCQERLLHKNNLMKLDQEHDIIEKEVIDLKATEVEHMKQIEQLQGRLEQNRKKISQRNIEIKKNGRQLEKYAQKIHEYKFKMNDLQKTKHVLSFRTTEMRKSLEPKEAQIEKLKDELQKLEEEFEKMLKTNQIQNDSLFKSEKKIDIYQSDLKNQRALTSEKETILNSMILDIDNCVNMKDKVLKYQVQEMVRIYQTYACGIKGKKAFHSRPSVQDMCREISALESQLFEMNDYTSKIVERRQKDIQNKTLENSELLNDLNQLRQRNKDLMHKILRKQHKKKQIQDEIKEYKRMERELKTQIQMVDQDKQSQSQSEHIVEEKHQQIGYQNQKRIEESKIQTRIYELDSGLQQVKHENEKVIFGIQELRSRLFKYLAEKNLEDFDFQAWEVGPEDISRKGNMSEMRNSVVRKQGRTSKSSLDLIDHERTKKNRTPKIYQRKQQKRIKKSTVSKSSNKIGKLPKIVGVGKKMKSP